jgi:microcystin-dependent protein
VAGTIATGGTSTAYTLTSNQGFDSLANMSGKMVAFIPHATNGATVTLNVDGLGAKALRSAPSVELPAGVLIQGTPYCAVYNNSTTEWILQGFWGANDYSIPLGAGVSYFGTSAPNSKFAFPSGQAISRSTYAALFALIGTTYGSGDGSTTFNLPSLGGRLLACRENMNGAGAEGRITSAGSGIDGATLGAAGGAQSVTLDTTMIPSHTHANSLSDPQHAHGVTDPNHSHTPAAGAFVVNSGGGLTIASSGPFGTAGSTAAAATGISINAASTGIGITNAAAGGGAAHNNMPPTMMVNFIMRVL